MFYHPSTKREFSSIAAFRAAYPNTSFGSLDSESERNNAGIFTIAEDAPAFNANTHSIAQNGVVFRNSQWCRDWVVAQRDVEAMRSRLLAAVAEKRWLCEASGLTLNGVRILTAVTDQNRITSVIANAQLAGVTSVDFKADSGWVTLSIAQLQGVAAAIALHVQACFRAERQHYEAIQAATGSALLTYDINANWPI